MSLRNRQKTAERHFLPAIAGRDRNPKRRQPCANDDPRRRHRRGARHHHAHRACGPITCAFQRADDRRHNRRINSIVCGYAPEASAVVCAEDEADFSGGATTSVTGISSSWRERRLRATRQGAQATQASESRWQRASRQRAHQLARQMGPCPRIILQLL